MIRPCRGPARRAYALAVVVPVVLIIGLSSCGHGSTTTVVPDMKRASTALNAGLKAHAAGNLTVAIADYRGALKYDPKNKFALYNLGVIDATKGNYGLAEDAYRVVLSLDPKYEPALFNLAILRTARGDIKEATMLYQRAVAVGGKAAAAWLNLGLLQRANGQRSAGDKSVQTAIRLDPKFVDPAKTTASAQPTTPSGTATK